MNKTIEISCIQEKQENTLMFCGMAFMVTGPAFWFLIHSVIGVYPASFTDTTGIVAIVTMAITLLLTASGAALLLAGWALAVWYAWRNVKTSGTV